MHKWYEGKKKVIKCPDKVEPTHLKLISYFTQIMKKKHPGYNYVSLKLALGSALVCSSCGIYRKTDWLEHALHVLLMG